MHQRPSRCWMCSNVSAATSDRRSPQPSRTARIARSRSPFFVVTSGVFSSVWACWTDSQFPTRTPLDLHALDARDAGGQFRRQQPVVGGLDRQLADRRDPHVDGNGAEPAGLECHAPGAHGRLGEAGPRLLAVPREEFVQAEIVDPLRDRGGDAVQDQRLQPAPICRPVRQHQFVHFVLVNGQYR